MQQVAALAPCHQVLELAVGRVVIEVAGSEAHEGPAEPIRFLRKGSATTAVIPPGAILAIKPAAVSHAEHDFAMWPAACLAAAVGSPKADGGRQLWPVNWVEGTMLGTDRHNVSRCDCR